MSKPKKAPWPPYLPADVNLADLGDARLAYLAARPELERRSRSNGWRVVGALTKRGIPRDIGHERTSDLLEAYAPAIEAAAESLSPADRVTLRRSGTLPDWFFDTVEAQRKAEGKT